MSRKSFSPIALSAVALALLAAPLQGQAEQVSVTGDRVGIWNIIGKVNVTPGTGRAVQVAVTRRGKDGAKLGIEHGTIRGRETIRVIYPSDNIVDISTDHYTGWRSDLRVRDDGTFGDGRDSDGRRVRIGDRGNGGLEAAADLDVQVPAGQEIIIYLVAGSLTARNLDGKIYLDTHRADVTASAMKGYLDIDAGSGDVKVDGMQGELRVDIGSGDVTIANVKGAMVDLDTGSGEVHGTAIAADALRIDTGSGGVEMTGLVAQRAELDVGSGDLDLVWDTDPGDINIDSGSGNVRLSLPATSGGELQIETSSGDIDSGFEIRTNRIERDALRGTFGDGKGRIVVDSGSGDVRIVKR